MRKPRYVLILLALVLITVTAITSAQDEPDPGHYLYNFCLNGTWFCPDSNDAAREAWNWGVAWYWGLYKAGDIGYEQVPEWARLFADSDGDGISDDADLCPDEGGNVDANGCPVPIGPPPPPAPFAGCHGFDNGYDHYYTGPINTPGNVHVFGPSRSGTCPGVASLTHTMWVDTILTLDTDVVAYCNTIGSGFTYAYNLVGFMLIRTPGIPSTFWFCL